MTKSHAGAMGLLCGVALLFYAFHGGFSLWFLIATIFYLGVDAVMGWRDARDTRELEERMKVDHPPGKSPDPTVVS